MTIDQIVADAKIAKGTFYLYFRSKRELLARLAETTIARMVEQANAIIASSTDDAISTFVRLFAGLKLVEREDQNLTHALNQPENIELHEYINIEFVRQLSPVLADLIARGCEEGMFDVNDPLATIQFILAGQAFLLGNNRFGWSDDAYSARVTATLKLTERALGAKPSSLESRLADVLISPSSDNR